MRFVDLTRPHPEQPDPTHPLTHLDLFYARQPLPMAFFVSPCVMLDARGATGGLITTQDVGGVAGVQPGDAVIIRTGWERCAGTKEYDQSPSVSRELLDALLQRKVRLILVDSPGVAGGASGELHNETDQYIVDRGAFPVENLTGLAALEGAGRFTLYCFPLPLEGKNALPVRAVAGLEG